MRQSDYNWYEKELQGNPLKTKTFTPKLTKKIKDRIMLSSINKQKSLLSKLSWTGLGSVCLIIIMLFTFNKNFSTTIMHIVSQIIYSNDSEAILEKLETQDGYKIVNQNKDVSINFRIEPEFLPKKVTSLLQ
jgi:uncharacterized membrane protein YvbJ